MVVSKGSKVIISNIPYQDDTTSITCYLAEDLTLSMQSSFTRLVEDNNNTYLTALGGALNQLSGGTLGGSGQVKQAGFQIWQSTEPIGVNLNVEFSRKLNAADDIAWTVQQLLKIPLPGENKGLLVPPGPSILEALGQEPKTSVGSYVDLTIGGLYLPKMICRTAEPTYSKYQDSSGYPIFVRVALNFISMFSGTKSACDYL